MDCLTDSEKNYLLHLLLSCGTKPDFNYNAVKTATGMASIGGARNKLPLILKKLRRERNLVAGWEGGVAVAPAGVAPAAAGVAPAAVVDPAAAGVVPPAGVGPAVGVGSAGVGSAGVGSAGVGSAAGVAPAASTVVGGNPSRKRKAGEEEEEEGEEEGGPAQKGAKKE